jgi:glycosyltransferase involved in cell wall biosynthesis
VHRPCRERAPPLILPAVSKPTISVVIATRNAGRYLAECLDSVTAQTRAPEEIVVIDAASTDDTLKIARRYPAVRVQQQDGLGFARAWNQGVEQSHGDYVALVDSDDRWTADKLALQGAMLDEDAAMEAVIGRVRFFLQPGALPPPGWRERLLEGEHVAQMPGVLLARRRLFNKVGMFGAEWTIASDIDWFVKLKDSGLKVGVVDELLLEKRVHSSNLSLVTARERIYPDEMLRLLRDSIRRKRERGAGP